MQSKSGLFARIGMSKAEFEKLADQHNALNGEDPVFHKMDGYVMSEAELMVFGPLFNKSTKEEQILLASMLRFIQREISQETA